MKTKKRFFLPLLTVIAALCLSLGMGGIVPVKSAQATTVNKDTFAGYFTAVGDNGLDAYVNDISYGTFTNTNFSGGGIMVETQNKKADGGWLINFPAVKYGAGVKFNGIVDISDNTASTTLMELAFPGSNDQAKGIKIIIEDAFNPSKYIALFIWHAYGNADAVGGKAWMGAAAGTWEKTVTGADVYINEAGFDTENYDDGYGAGFYPVGDKVDAGGSSAGNGEGCFLNYAEDGHTKTDIRLNSSSANSVKVQFDNANGSLSINGVHIRDFKNYSADGKHYFGAFKDNKVKLSVGVIRSNKGSNDDYARFCIMNIDGNDFTADGSNNVSYSGLDLTTPSYSTINKNVLVSNFTAVGDDGLVDYVNGISYGTFTNINFSGEGVMVETRNKTAELVDNTDLSNDTNPPLINFPSVKYSAGVKFNGVVDISDNTASDTLIELAFPGTNDNWQNRGFKVIIEDASDPDNYIALFVWGSYSNWDATGGSVIAAAAGTWEKTNFTSGDVYAGEAGFDTNNYKGNAIFSVVGDDLHDGAVGGEGKPSDGCFLNSEEYGHTKTKVNFSRTSENSIKVQFDNANGSLSINGVHIRDFKNFSADGTHYFPGFTNDEVKLSVSIVRTTKRSTDEFTRFCIMNIDEHSAKAPASELIASGTTDIPAPVSYSFFKGETAIDTFAVNITDPEGNTTENYSDATFTFDRIGTYEIEYLVNSASVGSASFAVAAKNAQDELAEVTSFEVSDNLFTGKKISLADFTLITSEQVAIESATVTIYKGEDVIATEIADADWTYTLADKGELTFKVANDGFTLVTSATVLPGLYPSAAIENGSVTINGAGDAVGLLVGTNDFVITPDKGYALASLTIGEEDVTEEVIDGEYTYIAESADDNVTYTVVFEKLPTVTVTFTADGETIETVSDLLNGTLFGEIEAPEIPAKENYDIVGWDIEDDFAITDNVTAEAVYAIKTFTITLDADGGSQIAAKTYTVLETVEEFKEIPEKEGFVFDAWYLGTEKYVFGGTLTSDITLTAKYNVKKLTVTVKSADFDDVVLTIDYNTAISADQLGEKSGYEFKGLFTDEGLTEAYNGENITADTTLYASYAKKSGCGGNILGSGFEFASLVTLIAAVLIVVSKNRKAKRN